MRKAAIITTVVAAACIVGLTATHSEADQGFTLAMEEGARKKWEAKLNDIIGEPFAKIAVCNEDAKMSLKLGKGCVEAASADICCDSWTIDLTCGDDGKWKQQAIDGASCKQTKRPKKP